MTTTETVLVEVSRRIAASPEQVFDAWLDPDQARHWLFATEGGVMERVEIDPRVGGSFRIDERRGDELAEHFGTYVEIDRPRRLVIDFGTSFEETKTRITVTIVPDDYGSLLTLLHEGVWPDWAEKTRQGWTMLSTGWQTWWNRRRPSQSRCNSFQIGRPDLWTFALLDREREGPAHAFRREIQRANTLQRARDDLFDDDMAETAPSGRHDGRSVALAPGQVNRVGRRVHLPLDRYVALHAGQGAMLGGVGRKLMHGHAQILNGLGPQGEWRSGHVDTAAIDLVEWLQLRRDQIAER